VTMVKAFISVPLVVAAIAAFAILLMMTGLSTPQPPTNLNPIEFLSRMTALDIFLIVLWIAAVIFGWNSGILRQLFLLASVLAGGMIAYYLVYTASYWTGAVSGAGRERMLPFTYTLLVVLVASVIFLLTVRSYPHTRLQKHKGPDQVVGALLGFVVGLLAVNLFAEILRITTNDTWLLLDGARVSIRQQLDSTPFVPLVAATFPQVSAIVRGLMPA
jgi:Colicin V production protein